MLLDYLQVPEAVSLRLAAVVLAVVIPLLYVQLFRGKKGDGKDAMEPPTLPSWIPWIGHGISFMRNSNGIIEAAIKHFASRRPFTLRIAGERLYILSAPDDVRELFKRTKELSFDPFVESIAINVYHFQGDDLEKLVRDRGGGSNIMNEGHNYYRKHLLPSSYLEDIKGRFVSELEEVLDGMVFPEEGVELFRWVCTTVATATTNSIMGKTFLKQNPAGILPALLDFDDAHIYMVYGLPEVFTAKGSRGRDLLLDELVRYLFSGEVTEAEKTDLIWRRQARLVETEFSQRAVAALQLTIYWAMQTNSMRIAFWTLSAILADPTLLSRVLDEIHPAFTGTALRDPAHIIDSCPTLATVFLESLRLSSGSASSRIVSTDTIVNGYLLRAGGKVLAPSIQPHLDTSQWGSDAGSFNASRWEAEGMERRMGLSYRPFGGGETYCPGRYFARVQVLTFVAGVLRRWRVARASGSWSKMDRRKPAIGILDPEGGVRVWWEERMGKNGVKCA